MFAGINVDAGDLKEAAIDKLSKLDQYFDKDVQCDITFETRNNDREKIVEVTIYMPGTILRAEETSDTFLNALDEAQETLERQIRKHKTKLQNRYQDNNTIRFTELEEMSPDQEEEDRDPQIVKVKSFSLKPMVPEEACLQMDMLGHNFFVFLDGEDSEVKVVYKRNDGDYGMIEPTLEG